MLIELDRPIGLVVLIAEPKFMVSIHKYLCDEHDNVFCMWIPSISVCINKTKVSVGNFKLSAFKSIESA